VALKFPLKHVFIEVKEGIGVGVDKHEEIADVIAFLAGERADFITGQTLVYRRRSEPQQSLTIRMSLVGYPDAGSFAGQAYSSRVQCT
jgi:hypothetical protein